MELSPPLPPCPSAQLKEEIAGLKESDAWPAQPQDAYGLEKLVSEELLMHYAQVRAASSGLPARPLELWGRASDSQLLVLPAFGQRAGALRTGL